MRHAQPRPLSFHTLARLAAVAGALLSCSPEMQAQAPAAPPLPAPAAAPSVGRARELFERAAILTQDKNYAEAIPLFEEAIRLDPAIQAAWESLGWAYWRTNREKDAIALWERLRAIDPASPLPYALLAKVAAAKADLPQAIAMNRRSLELRPDQPAVKYDLARILLWNGQIEEGIALLNRIYQEDPERVDVVQELAQSLSFGWQYEQALPLWQKLRNRSPANLDFLAMEATCLLHVNQPEPAREKFAAVLAAQPRHLVALLGMANLEEFSPNAARALPYLRDLLKAQPDPAEKESVRIRLLNLLVRLHRLDPLAYTLNEPLALVQDRLDYNPNSVDALLLRGELLLQDLKFVPAEEQFIQVLSDFNPRNIRARKGLFETYIAVKRFPQAREQLDALRLFNPRDPYLDYYVARLESTRGNFPAAFDALDRLEAAGRRGAVAVVLYHGLTLSRYFPDALALDRFRGHLQAMREAGFQFVRSGDIPALFAPSTNAASPAIVTDNVPMMAAVPDPAPVPAAKPAPRIRSAAPASRGRKAPQPLLSALPPPPPPEPVVFEPEPVPTNRAPARPAMPVQVSINFDDARKDSMHLGTTVAREFGLVFSHHVPCGYIMRNHPFIVSWNQLQDYASTGCWEIGCHFLDAAILTGIGATNRLGRPLPNLIWRPESGRLETPDEYLERLEREVVESRLLLQQHSGQRVNFISYPFGDIGQELDTNLENPAAAIIETSRAHYDAGFLQSAFGFAIAGDDPMLYQRHEMDRWMEGSNVVDYVYAHHPVFLAHRTRAEYASLSGKQYRAMENVEWLKANRYPERLVEETRRYVETKLAGGFVRPVKAAESQKALRDMDTLKPRLRGEGEFFRDNQDRSHWRLYGGGGLNLGERIALDAKAGYGRLTQKLAVITNNAIVGTRDLEVSEQSVGLRGTLLFVPDPVHPTTDYFPKYITAGLLQRRFSGDADSSVTAWDVELQQRPLLPIDLMVRYEHDIVPSALAAVEEITQNAWLLTGVYRLRDWWDVSASGVWFDFSDDNTRDHLNLGTRWLLHERTGFWAGLRYAFVSAAEERQAYWTPYQLNRYSVEGQFRGNYLRTYYNLSVNYGIGKENVRPEAKQRYAETQSRAQREGFDPGEPPSTDWEPVFGASLSLRAPRQDRWELNGEIAYNQNPDYNELSIFGGVSLFFH